MTVQELVPPRQASALQHFTLSHSQRCPLLPPQLAECPSLPGFLFSGRFASVGVNHHRLCSAVFQFTETPNGELPGLVFSPEILNSI